MAINNYSFLLLSDYVLLFMSLFIKQEAFVSKHLISA